MDTDRDYPNQETRPMRNIVLVGFMGSGKSSVGRELHQNLGYKLIDTDRVIEDQTGQSIPEIFARHGEPAFRDMETRLLENLLQQNTQHHIISTGGGMACNPCNSKLLRKLGYVVWLQCTVQDIIQRTSKSTNRPLLQCDNPEETIIKLLEDRTPHYEACAHLAINTTGLNLDEVCCGILESARYYFSSL